MDWILPDSAKHVSGHHFDIQYSDGAYWLRDVSTNGTYLQGSHSRVDGPLQLKGSERLIAGRYIIAVELSTPQVAPPVRQGQPGVTVHSLGGLGTNARPLGKGPDGNVDGFPPANPRPNPHHPDKMAQGFAPLQQPSNPQHSSAEMPPLQRPDAQPLQGDAVQQPPPRQASSPVPPLAMPKAVPMPPLGDPSETIIKPPPRRPSPPPPAAVDPATTARQPDAQAILAAFCTGAGLDPKAVEGVDPLILVEALGKSTRVAVEEIMLMLKDRANVKQFTRGGERTMRSATDNNPMKFMQDAEQAFSTLLIKPRDGFMTGAEGFENALSDLRNHQTAVFAALQPALAEVLAGLAPDEVSDRDDTSKNLLSGSKKARNWDAFVKRWDTKTGMGDHGMLDVFLNAFAKAYASATADSGQS